MPGRIPENILEEILGRLDIVEVISGYMPLKRAGRNFKACCPFHHEKTPSFMVSPDKQIFHCFGCQESGNAFKFIMRYERMDFPEAVEILAKKAGVILPETSYQSYSNAPAMTPLYGINDSAALFYHDHLNSPAAAPARQYLIKRGITQETAKAMKLGFAPSGWDSLISNLKSKGTAAPLLEKSGLVVAREGGGHYDRFRSRIIFPIFDMKSRVVAFGARVLDETLPKYINSPESPIYTKGKHLYGLHLAKEAIRDNDAVVIVEGYLDFILPFQAGIKNIVASLGTALTTDQVRLLKRYASKAVMIYDADAAGELATLRSLDIFIEEDMDVKVASLEEGLDPDLFVRKYGADAFRARIDSSLSLFDYKLKMLEARHDINEPEGKRTIFTEMFSTLKKIKNQILLSEYIKKLAEHAGVSEDYVLRQFKVVKGELKADRDVDAFVEKKKPAVNPMEKLLLKLMLEESETVRIIRESLEPADFQDERVSRLVSVLFDLVDQGKSIEPRILMNHFGEEEISQIVCESMFMPEEMMSEDREKIIVDCVKRLKCERQKLKRESLHNQIKSAQDLGDEQRVQLLMQEFHSLIKKR